MFAWRHERQRCISLLLTNRAAALTCVKSDSLGDGYRRSRLPQSAYPTYARGPDAVRDLARVRSKVCKRALDGIADALIEVLRSMLQRIKANLESTSDGSAAAGSAGKNSFAESDVRRVRTE
jgi:hypothetical protein